MCVSAFFPSDHCDILSEVALPDVQAEIPAVEAPNAETLIGIVLGVLSHIQDMNVFHAIAGEIEVVIPENAARSDVLRLLRGRWNTVEFEDLPDVI